MRAAFTESIRDLVVASAEKLREAEAVPERVGHQREPAPLLRRDGKREAMEPGLRTLLRLQKQSRLRKYRGKLSWQGGLEQMRKD